jgi:hypothetical protein
MGEVELTNVSVSQHGDVTDESNMAIKTTQNKSKKGVMPISAHY